MARVLVIDDEMLVINVLSKVLQTVKHEVTTVQDGSKAVDVIKQNQFDLMICDLKMSPISGMELLKIVHTEKPTMPVLMVTGYATVATAVEALRLGAFDYITKPFKIDELLSTVQRGIEYGMQVGGRVDTIELLDRHYGLPQIIAASPAMHGVCETIRRVATTDAPILIFGEPGTGKSTIAKAIHALSLRKDAQFVRVNCAAVETASFTSEFFGSAEPGGSAGSLAAAQKGSLFMEELESLPRDIQNRLDGVLQEKKLIKAGAKCDEPLDIRMIAATTKHLESLLQEGNFNRSLFFRLKGIQIEVKALRERREDIIPMALHILHREVAEGRKPPVLAQEVRELFARYSWPGNTTELETVLEYAIKASKGGDTITKDCLPADVVSSVKTMPAASDSELHRGEKLKQFLQKKLGT